MESSCSKRTKSKDDISECFTFECTSGIVRFLYRAVGVRPCGTFTIKAEKACSRVIINVNFEDVDELSEGESITITMSDIERISVRCTTSTSQPTGMCKVSFCFEPKYTCC
ncbi:S-Ena type endospore appendage [Pontibacillus sp. HMF3514]|uniref:S-Ena type endospore appendage n=1 Tax=Pontibacillus sp. HMF3514 TaxID=2692425 RepID=UPI00351B6D20